MNTEFENMVAKKKNSMVSQMRELLAVVIMIIFGVLICSSEGNAASAEDKRKGFHCLSSWDGSHRDFKSMVKRRLNDPDSFKHIETRVGPNNNGNHVIKMTYSAKNGFGGRIKAVALGSYSNATCKAVVEFVQ